jgi:alpha-glucosidase
MHKRPFRHLPLVLCFGMAASAVTATQSTSTMFTAKVSQGTLTLSQGSDHVAINFVSPDTVHVHVSPNGSNNPPSVMIDPAAPPTPSIEVKTGTHGTVTTLSTTQATLRWDGASGSLQLTNAEGHVLLSQHDLAALIDGRLLLEHDSSDPVYGIGGYNASEDASASLLRTDKQKITAGEQGHAGAPLVWSTGGYAILVDTLSGHFNLTGTQIAISDGSRKDLDYYLMVGSPRQIFADIANISGHTPLFPKWAMGFTNSQWGIDQQELTRVVDTYRTKHIPIDNITLDFDWKAWGEDNYGEFRWNPIKFPDGPNGALKKQMDARGIHLTGIMKPRIHLDTVEGRYASAHGFWVPHEKVSDDYFSHQPVKDINFDLAVARQWFGDLAIKYGYAYGISGWWNDEADTVGSTTEFLNMQRALYDSQRAVTKQRVWSINRNFWLGAQRYAYGLWSGDINTGFANMAAQRVRMLSAINVGAMQWGMDGGGFRGGTPTPENYARWIQFGAFTPIFRVHGDFGQKRQPWVYGPVAEKSATDAIRLRYALIPYIYSYEHGRRMGGVGLVRPLLFDWPHDANVSNDINSWLFGDWLLVSPVVKQGQTAKDIYLPVGQWTNWFSGKVYDGGQTIHLAVDAKHWSDIPLFVRDGAIIPSQPPMDYVGEQPLTLLDVDVFPADQRSAFDYYDDDGSSYDYEHGAYFIQQLSVQQVDDNLQFDIGEVAGSFRPALKFYLLKIHGYAANAVSGTDRAEPFNNLASLRGSHSEGWSTGTDRFGAVTYVKVTAAKVRKLRLVWGKTSTRSLSHDSAD